MTNNAINDGLEMSQIKYGLVCFKIGFGIREQCGETDFDPLCINT